MNNMNKVNDLVNKIKESELEKEKKKEELSHIKQHVAVRANGKKAECQKAEQKVEWRERVVTDDASCGFGKRSRRGIAKPCFYALGDLLAVQTLMAVDTNSVDCTRCFFVFHGRWFPFFKIE